MINIIEKNFQNDGFVVIKSLFSKSEIDQISPNIIKIAKKCKKKKNKKYINYTSDNKINDIHNINYLDKNNYVVKLVKKKKLVKLIEKFIGPKPKLRNVEFFLKPKKSGNSVPFHQDNAFWCIKNGSALNVWIACTKVTKKNSGVVYLKGSHKMNDLKHKISFHPGTSQCIPKNVLKRLKFTKVTPSLEKGDCIIHSFKIIHGSKKNLSSMERIGLVASYKSNKSIINNKKIKIYRNNLKENLKNI